MIAERPRFGDHVEYVGEDGSGFYVGMIVDFAEEPDPKSPIGIRFDKTLPIIAKRTPAGAYTETPFRLDSLRTSRAPV